MSKEKKNCKLNPRYCITHWAACRQCLNRKTPSKFAEN